MTPDQARTWIIKYTLMLYTLLCIFFLLALAIGYPLGYPDSINILEILLPILLGYLGAAAQFVIGPRIREDVIFSDSRKEMLSLIARWPIIAFVLAMTGVLFAFWWSNRSQDFTGNGITPNTLSLIVSIISGILATTTGALTSYLFQTERSAGESPIRPRMQTRETTPHRQEHATVKQRRHNPKR